MQDSIDDINKNQPDSDDDFICREALRILHAIKTPDVSAEINSRKEPIFQLINRKIEARKEVVTASQPVRFWKRLMPVAAVFLLLLSIGLSTYQIGYGSGMAVRAEAMVEVQSPLGVLSSVLLPDGSKVTLNAGSTLIYPSVFSSERKVTLKGEGYFEIAKDKCHPFIVHAEGMNVKVLGTRFSLKAYQKEDQTLLTLEEGCVEATTNIGEIAENIVLMPNQQLMLNNRTGELRRKTVNADYYTRWRSGNLIFRDAPLESITKELERRFNVRIQFEDTVYRAEKYYVVFEHGESLDQILSLLSYKRDWEYRMNGKHVEIVNKK